MLPGHQSARPKSIYSLNLALKAIACDDSRWIDVKNGANFCSIVIVVSANQLGIVDMYVSL